MVDPADDRNSTGKYPELDLFPTGKFPNLTRSSEEISDIRPVFSWQKCQGFYQIMTSMMSRSRPFLDWQCLESPDLGCQIRPELDRFPIGKCPRIGCTAIWRVENLPRAAVFIWFLLASHVEGRSAARVPLPGVKTYYF